MIYSVPYLLLISFYGIMALWYNQTKNLDSRPVNVSLCMLVTLLFWGFRGFCFYDWMSYYPMFLHAGIENFSDNITSMEPGFCLLMTACKEIYDSYIFFAFVCSLINLALLSNFLLKHTDNYPLALLIGTIFGCFYLFTDLMRNAIAVFIFINAIDYLAEKKIWKYFLMVLLSLSFHYSAILYIPLYFFARKKMKRWVFATIFFAGVVIYVLHISLFVNLSTFLLGLVNPDLEEKVRYYLDETAAKSPGINFVFLEQVFTGGLVLFYMDKLREVRKNADIYINCILLFFVMTFMLHEFVTLSFRMSILFGVGYWIIWLDLLKCFKFTNNRRLFILFICVYCFLRILGHTRNPLANYNNVLIDYESYQERVIIFKKTFKD